MIKKDTTHATKNMNEAKNMNRKEEKNKRKEKTAHKEQHKFAISRTHSGRSEP